MATNSDIQDQHDALVASISDLSSRLGDTADATQQKQIVVQMQQLTDRMNRMQNLLFVAQSEAISQQTTKVTQAQSKLEQSIAEDASMAEVVGDVSSVLTEVDNTIAVAQKLII